MVVVFFVAAGYISYRHFELVDHTNERQLDLDRIQRDYYERVGYLRSATDEKAYKDSVNSFFRWYFEAVDKHVAKFNENKEFTDYIKDLEAGSGKDVEKSAGKSEYGKRLTNAVEKKAMSISDRRVKFDQEKKLFDLFRSGRYQPVFTGTSNGVRMDIVSNEVTTSNGKPVIRFQVVVWGAAREMVEAEGKKSMQTDAAVSSTWKLYDAKNKFYGEMSVGGLGGLNPWPERLINVFPPQMVLGYLDMEKVPAVADHVEITFTVSSKQPMGGTAEGTYTWKMPVPSEWKLGAGQAWEGATEQTRSEDEIGGKPQAKK
jgi:hypothetical protein